jgi:hypothetical protein
MSDSSTPTPKPASSGFTRKVALLILLEIDAAFGLFILFRYRTDYPLLGLNILTISLLGFLAGLATRIVLRQRHWFVRFVTGIASLIIGLLVLGLLMNWRVGLGPLVFWRRNIDWIGLGKLFVGILCFVLAMQAWRKKPAPAVEIVSTLAAAEPSKPPARSKVRASRRTSKQFHLPISPARSKPAAAKKSAKAIVSSKQLSKPVTKPRRSLFQHKPQVHLSKIERHLCPYCLEPVTRNDSRGVVECDICHTLHHGDCWAIAGVCQVPHYTA